MNGSARFTSAWAYPTEAALRCLIACASDVACTMTSPGAPMASRLGGNVAYALGELRTGSSRNGGTTHRVVRVDEVRQWRTFWWWKTTRLCWPPSHTTCVAKDTPS